MVQIRGEISICVISVWFGEWPSYLFYFLKTCTANKYIDWILISDQEILHKPADNITVLAMTKSAFADTATDKLGFNVTIDDPYKVCDYKPLFGKIFEDHLKAYKYWGYCDLDMVFGDIHNHILPLLLEKPVIISFYPDFLSGPFCLYQNISTVNELFRNCPGYRSILQDPKHRAFDENIPRNVAGIRRILYQILYLLRLIFIGPRYHLHIPEIRYHFQWYYKKLNSKTTTPSDMTEVVYKAMWDKQIKVTFRDLLRSDRAYWRQGRTSWKLSWQDAKMVDIKNGEDIFAYHFVDSKNNPEFVMKLNADNMDKFTISEGKIESNGYEKTGK